MIPTLRSHYRIGKNCYKTIVVEQNWILREKFLRRYSFVSGDVNTGPSFTMFMWRQDLFVGPFVQRIRDALGAEGHDFHYTREFFEEVFALRKFYTRFNYVVLRRLVDQLKITGEVLFCGLGSYWILLILLIVKTADICCTTSDY